SGRVSGAIRGTCDFNTRPEGQGSRNPRNFRTTCRLQPVLGVHPGVAPTPAINSKLCASRRTVGLRSKAARMRGNRRVTTRAPFRFNTHVPASRRHVEIFSDLAKNRPQHTSVCRSPIASDLSDLPDGESGQKPDTTGTNTVHAGSTLPLAATKTRRHE